MLETQASLESPIVVGIGASAGGLEAIQEMFDHLDGDSGAAFVVVQHLSPDFKSLMDEILKRHTGMQVVKVKDRVELRANTVYLLPPRSYIVVQGSSLEIREQVAESGQVPRPIDEFLCSLARERGEASVAIILSGTGSDGARGVREVKDAGGIVLVQDPTTAGFDGMPTAAIATACTDFVLSPRDLAERVSALVKHPFLRSAARGQLASERSSKPYDAILEILKGQLGCDMTAYKPGTLIRRIERRMSLHHLSDPEKYLDLLEADADECALLARDCLINVTQFFRDRGAYAALAKQLQERLLADRDSKEPFRVWVAGCATGEEAYSVAALIERTLADLGVRRGYKIFATDIAERVLEKAGAGVYPLSIEDEVPPGYREHLGTREGKQLRISPELRNKIVFARHDLLKDPPFPHADLVTCRNMLIYFKPEAQRLALERFHFSLRSDALLFLGSSESVEVLADNFETVDAKHKIFRKRAGSRLVPAFGTVPGLMRDRQVRKPARAGNGELQELPIVRACERLVQMFATAGAIVDDAGHVVYSFGRVGEWLKLPRGRVTTNLLDLLPESSVEATRWALRQARYTGEPVRVARIPIDDEEYSLDLVHVEHDGAPRLDVILLGARTDEPPPSAAPPSLDVDLDSATRQQIESLERDLASTRESLQTTIEELETSNEELQSTNEELLASNEELQSTNEELHSVNEELYTVNAEHAQKIAELSEVTADLEHLLDNTAIGTLFLDSKLRVRKFTPTARIALPLRDRDVERAITELTTRLPDIDLGEIARRVLDEGEPFEEKTATEQGTPVHLRALPYRAGSDEVGGVVFTFIDISHLEEAQRGVNERAAILRSIEETSKDVFWTLDEDTMQFRYLSPSYERVWGRSRSDGMRDARSWFADVHPDDRVRVEREWRQGVKSGQYDAEYRIVRPDGEVRWIQDRVHGVVEDGAGRTVIGSAEDVTSRVQLDEEHRQSMETHRKANDHAFVPMLFLRRNGAVIWGNRAARRELVGDSEATLPRRLTEVLRTDDGADVLSRALERAAASGSAVGSLELELARPASQGGGGRKACEIHVAHVEAEGDEEEFFVCQLVDLTDQVTKASQLESKAAILEEEADRDALTGLLNRRGLERVLARELAVRSRTGDPTAVILIDCDRFKQINDGLGHAAGDCALEEIGRRLGDKLRPTDLLARVGGDEFLAVLPGARLAEGAHVGEKLRRAVAAEPVRYRGRDIEVTVSVGVVPAPSDVSSASELMALAGAMLSQSKHVGRNRVSFASEGDASEVTRAERALDKLLGGEIRVVEQTLHRIPTSEPVGHELFTRGPEPLEQPLRFFDASRRADCLERADLACFERCIRHAEQLSGDGRVHVNLFPSTLLADADGVFERVAAHAGATERLCIELSEQQFVGPSANLRERIEKLRGHGLKIAIDNVGYGRTALETLIALEPDVVKLHRSLTAEVDRSDPARRVLERIVALFRASGAELIAEGIEREGQRRVLEELGVELGQGFLWSRPDDTPAPPVA